MNHSWGRSHCCFWRIVNGTQGGRVVADGERVGRWAVYGDGDIAQWSDKGVSMVCFSICANSEAVFMLQGSKVAGKCDCKKSKCKDQIFEVWESGARGLSLKYNETAEMYQLRKQIFEVYTVEKFAKKYRIMRQTVGTIL